MKYQIKRGEQIFGPYTLADLQRYVQTGNIVLTDLTQSEGMSDWAPVSQVIGNITVPASVYSPPAYSPATVGYGAAAAPVAQPGEMVELAPNLHWALLLLIEIFTLGIFNLVWALVLANWARKLDKDNNTLIMIALYPAGAISAGIIAAVTGGSDSPLAGLSTIIQLGTWIVYLIGIFKIKSAMEEYYNSTENFGLRLSGVMTFFFSTIYLQYHVNQLSKFKATAPLGISYR